MPDMLSLLAATAINYAQNPPAHPFTTRDRSHPRSARGSEPIAGAHLPPQSHPIVEHQFAF